MTYTNTPGRIGERGIYTGESSYNASSDADKLITASALKGAFDSIPTTDTTTLVCANPGVCDLWTIVDQTAMGPSAASGAACPDLMSLIGDVEGTGSGYIFNNGNMRNNESTYGLSQNGTWVVDYGDGKMISGKSQCTSQIGTNNDRTWTNPTISATLPDSTGQYCYCQLDGYATTGGSIQSLSAPWVFLYTMSSTPACALFCTLRCADYLVKVGADYYLAFRAAMFNSCGM